MLDPILVTLLRIHASVDFPTVGIYFWFECGLKLHLNSFTSGVFPRSIFGILVMDTHVLELAIYQINLGFVYAEGFSANQMLQNPQLFYNLRFEIFSGLVANQIQALPKEHVVERIHHTLFRPEIQNSAANLKKVLCYVF